MTASNSITAQNLPCTKIQITVKAIEEGNAGNSPLHCINTTLTTPARITVTAHDGRSAGTNPNCSGVTFVVKQNEETEETGAPSVNCVKVFTEKGTPPGLPAKTTESTEGTGSQGAKLTPPVSSTQEITTANTRQETLNNYFSIFLEQKHDGSSSEASGKIIELLKENDDITLPYNFTKAHWAGIVGDAEWLDSLLKADPNLVESKTDIDSSILYGRLPAAVGDTVCGMAAYLGNLECSRTALQHGARLDHVNHSENSTLYLLAHKLPLKELISLLNTPNRADQIKAVINHQTSRGSTILHALAERKAQLQSKWTVDPSELQTLEEIVSLVTKQGADLKLTNQDGKTYQQWFSINLAKQAQKQITT